MVLSSLKRSSLLIIVIIESLNKKNDERRFAKSIINNLKKVDTRLETCMRNVRNELGKCLSITASKSGGAYKTLVGMTSDSSDFVQKVQSSGSTLLTNFQKLMAEVSERKEKIEIKEETLTE